MTKCAICKTEEAIWAWQPFGPDPDPVGTFAGLGNHYRGFPVIKVCELCRIEIRKDGTHVEFDHKGTHYIMDADGPQAVPAYVADALLWLEETRGKRGK